MMHPLYLLEAPSGRAVPPEHWSYSTLRAFRQCPKRWWLERCRYPNVTEKFYPVQTTTPVLEGQLVHRIVEEWGKAVRRREDPGSVRLKFKLALREALTTL